MFGRSFSSSREPGRSPALSGVLPWFLAFALVSCASSSPTKTLTNEDRAALYIDAANAALSDGDTVTALEDLKKAEGIAPKAPELYHTRGLVFAYKKDLPAAITWVRKALELNAVYSAANNTLGKLLMDSGKPDEAVQYLLAAGKDPMNREAYKAYTNLGILYYRKMEYAKAGQYLEEAITADPNGSCIAYYYRGHLELQKGQFPRAIRDYDQATRHFCSGFADAHLALGIALERSGQYDAARRKFLEIQQRFATSAVAEQAIHHLRKLP